MTTIREQFETQGFATLSYNDRLRTLADNMMALWKAFCALPLDTKCEFVYDEELGTGYEYKDQPGPARDIKENFHFTLNDLPRIYNILRKNRLDPSFVVTAQSLLQNIVGMLRTFGGKLEEEFGLAGVRDELIDSRNNWCLRLLHYPALSEVGKVIAWPHCDKLGLSLYVKETASGVQYYTRDGQWVNMPMFPGQAVVTPNMQMQLRSRGDITALCHRVVANETTSRHGRYSIVCFAGLAKTPHYNKVQYGPLQGFPVGFNYRLPHNDFSKYFIG